MLRVQDVSEGCREVGIIRGYRPEHCTLTQCAALLFRVSNETVNVWTHLLASSYFAWQLLELLPGVFDPMTQPFVSYLSTVTLYLLMSCLAHALACLSPEARHVCYCMDYAALSIFSFGAAVLYSAYCFPTSLRNIRWVHMYLVVSALLSVACTLIACASRLTEDLRTQKVLRLGAFVLPYAWVNAPLMLRLASVDRQLDAAWPFHIGQFVAMGLAAFFYGTHLPERLAPGRFDIFGHSHNLLHICGTAATVMQMRGGLLDMAALEDRPIGVVGPGVVASITLLNVGLVGVFLIYCPEKHLKDK